MKERDANREQDSKQRGRLGRWLGRSAARSEQQPFIQNRLVAADGTNTLYNERIETIHGGGFVDLNMIVPRQLGETTVVSDPTSKNVTRLVHIVVEPFMTPDGELGTVHRYFVSQETTRHGDLRVIGLGEQTPADAFDVSGGDGTVVRLHKGATISRYTPLANNEQDAY
jgi:hypothetical protein